MSKKSVLKPALLHAGGNRNAFPIGHTEVFQAPLGALLPVAYYKVPANSYFEMNMENQTVLAPILKPAFTILKEHFDVFAVPMCQLLQRFDNFITGQSVYDNAAIQYPMLGGGAGGSLPQVPQSVPMFDGKTLAATLYSLNSKVDMFGVNKAYNACRLLDMLGYGNYYDVVPSLTGVFPADSSTSTVDSQFADTVLPMNFFNLLAYQKIYYSHYANKKYESIDARSFNIDDLDNQTYSVTSATERYEMFMDFHYVQAKKDYFNSIEPYILPMGNNIGFTSLQLSAIQGNIWQLFGVPGTTLNTYNNYPAPQDLNASGNETQAQGQSVKITSAVNYGGYPVSANNGNTVSAIRFAFAYDKLLRRMRSAGPSFNAQMLAQFGIKPIDERHGDAKMLGGWTNQLRISEVTSTAVGDGVDLGSLGGKSVNYVNNKKRIKYHAKEDCIIMVVYHTSIDPMYHSFNVDRDNLCKYRFDWFNPVFENMGLQPVFGVEYSNIAEDISTGDFSKWNSRDSAENQRKILGYNKRYMEYKTKTNKVHGLFQWPYGVVNMQSWVPTKRDLIIDPVVSGEYSTYFPIPFVKASFVQSPFSLNDILAQPYNGEWASDPFYVFAYFDAKLIANMSVDGESF